LEGVIFLTGRKSTFSSKKKKRREVLIPNEETESKKEGGGFELYSEKKGVIIP